MTPFDLARFGGEPKRLRCNAEQTRRLVQIKPWLVPVWRRPKDRDLMMGPERGDPLPCPAIAVAGHQAVPVEDAGNQLIIGDENQFGGRRRAWRRRCCCAARGGASAGAVRYERRRANGSGERSLTLRHRYRRPPRGGRGPRF